MSHLDTPSASFLFGALDHHLVARRDDGETVGVLFVGLVRLGQGNLEDVRSGGPYRMVDHLAKEGLLSKFGGNTRCFPNTEPASYAPLARLDQQATGLMSLEAPGSKLGGLEESRKLVHAELAAVRTREKRVEELENDRDALLESGAGAVPEALGRLTGQEKNKPYRMLRLEVMPTVEGFNVAGASGNVLHSESGTKTSVCDRKLDGGFRFKAVLSEHGSRLELMKGVAGA
jgi:hypothetical protein